MGIEAIQIIKLGEGGRFVPQWPSEHVLSEKWEEVEWRAFHDETRMLFGGTWRGEPGTLRLDPYPYNEVCVMLSGKVALIDTEGRRRDFAAGEAFFVPKGFRGVWETVEPSSKIFVAFDPNGHH